jgi:antitoxin CptB
MTNTLSTNASTFNDNDIIDERALSKLRWRCRRGLLENDILIERFFDRYDSSITVAQAQGLSDLMELSDNDLLDLLLSRKPLEVVAPEINNPRTEIVLKMLKGKS